MVARATGEGAKAPRAPIEPLIGPNAILQLVPVLEAHGGTDFVQQLLARAGIAVLPDGQSMIPQSPAARLHQALRAELPYEAPTLARAAGLRTGDYILAHRIPRAAQTLLRWLPRSLAAGALSRAIGKHAWTFAGSGRFQVEDSWQFSLAHNPIVAGERSDKPLCHWHAAVFERLYACLVDAELRCRETQCCAMGAPACHFEIH